MSFGPMSARRARHLSWWAVAVVLLAAQVAVGLHQIEHRLKPHLAGEDTCIVCQVAGNMVTGPEPAAIAPPVPVVVERIAPASALLPAPLYRASAFHPRGPPPIASV